MNSKPRTRTSISKAVSYQYLLVRTSTYYCTRHPRHALHWYYENSMAPIHSNAVVMIVLSDAEPQKYRKKRITDAKLLTLTGTCVYFEVQNIVAIDSVAASTFSHKTILPRVAAIFPAREWPHTRERWCCCSRRRSHDSLRAAGAIAQIEEVEK